MKRDSTAKEIGDFLQAGVDHKDQWNKGGEQANLVAQKAIKFKELAERMIVKGQRCKFKVEAQPIGGSTPINIEISCDHTAGIRPDPDGGWYNPETDKYDAFADPRNLYHHIYNIEIELEHQGVTIGGGGSGGTGGSKSGPPTTSFKDEGPPLQGPEQQVQPVPEGRIPSGHPGRLYMRDDTQAKQFNTPSFEIFYHAHDRIISWMRKVLGDEQELKEDKQKVESMRDDLYPEARPPQQEDGDDEPVAQALPTSTTALKEQYKMSNRPESPNPRDVFVDALLDLKPELDRKQVNERLERGGFQRTLLPKVKDPNVGVGLFALLGISDVALCAVSGFKLVHYPHVGQGADGKKILLLYDDQRTWNYQSAVKK
jgi:hypothetical protein